MNPAIINTMLDDPITDQELDVSPEDWVPEHDHWSDMIDANQEDFEKQLKLVLIRFQASFDGPEVQ